MTELFSAEHRTFFFELRSMPMAGILSYFCFAWWPTWTRGYQWSLGKIAKILPTDRAKIGINYYIILKLFVCLLDLGFTPNNFKLFVGLLDLQFRSRFLCTFCMLGSVRFWFEKQNLDWFVLFVSGRTVKHYFGRSLDVRLLWFIIS